MQKLQKRKSRQLGASFSISSDRKLPEEQASFRVGWLVIENILELDLSRAFDTVDRQMLFWDNEYTVQLIEATKKHQLDGMGNGFKLGKGRRNLICTAKTLYGEVDVGCRWYNNHLLFCKKDLVTESKYYNMATKTKVIVVSRQEGMQLEVHKVVCPLRIGGDLKK